MPSCELLLLASPSSTSLGATWRLDRMRPVHHHSFLLVIALSEVLFEQVVLFRHHLPRGENGEEARVPMLGKPLSVLEF